MKWHKAGKLTWAETRLHHYNIERTSAARPYHMSLSTPSHPKQRFLGAFITLDDAKKAAATHNRLTGPGARNNPLSTNEKWGVAAGVVVLVGAIGTVIYYATKPAAAAITPGVTPPPGVLPTPAGTFLKGHRYIITLTGASLVAIPVAAAAVPAAAMILNGILPGSFSVQQVLAEAGKWTVIADCSVDTSYPSVAQMPAGVALTIEDRGVWPISGPAAHH